MRKTTLILLLVATICASAWAGGFTPVFLYNPESGAMRECRTIKGKHDAFARYECSDAKTKKFVAFDPGKEWLSIESVCFRDKTVGTIKNQCALLPLGKADQAKYICLDKANKFKHFPPGDDWERLPGNDYRCQPIRMGKNVIKAFRFEIETALKAASADQNKNETLDKKGVSSQ